MARWAGREERSNRFTMVFQQDATLSRYACENCRTSECWPSRFAHSTKITIIIKIQLMSSEKNAPRYFMHKYWGKKPAFGISPLIDKYTNPGDMIIDHF